MWRTPAMTSTVIPGAAYADLAAALRGELITPADPGYDEARAVYNGMIDKHPAAIARCRDAADVITAVRFARAQDLRIAVRGGGHNAAGFGTTPSSSTSRRCAPRPSTPCTARCAWTPGAPGATSTTPPSRSGWPPPRASWP